MSLKMDYILPVNHGSKYLCFETSQDVILTENCGLENSGRHVQYVR